MIFLDKSTDSILPYGLDGTPFAIVYEALQAVAGDVWAVDPAAYRAGIAWGYYLTNDPEKLIELAAGRQYIVNILLGEQIPLIKDTQTTAELVDLLTLWRDYSPTFPKLEALYKPYAADVDIRPITDPYAQSILPVSDIKNAFYVLLRDTDPTRPLLLGEAALIAECATPMGSRPIVIGQVASDPIEVHADMAWGDVCIYVENFDLPDPPPVVPDKSPKSYIVVDSTGTVQHSIDQDSMFIHQIQHSVEVVNFYFTSNGAAQTENSELESGVDVTLYNADGTIADDDLYDGSGTLTYTQANGNMFEAADGGDLISLQSGALVMNPNADYTALSVQVEEYAPNTLDIILALRWDPDNNQWKTVAFDQELNDNFWWSCLLSENDKTKVTNFGLSTIRDTTYYTQGDVGAIVWDNRYTFEVLDIYSDLGQTSVPGYDLSHLTAKAQDASQSKYTLTIWSDVQDSTLVKAWKCRISKKPYIDVDFAFAFDSATGTIPEAVQPTSSDWWSSGILTQDDEDRINAFGLQTNIYSNRQGTIGSVIYDNNYLFEMIGMFADVVDGHGSGSIAYDPSKFYCSGRGMGTGTYLVINNTDAFPTAAKVWRCRITRLNP